MIDKVQKIRKEVVRMHNLLPVLDGDNIYLNYADRICTTLEMYIDSLQEEPVSEGLEKAAVEAFKQIVDSDKNNFLEIFKAGAEWQKQQMMKDAIYACVTDIRTYKEENEIDFTVIYEKGIIPYEIEQEVKLIIIKDD